MDMATHTITSGMTATGTALAATATPMSSGMGGSGCKISMLWNWSTVDSCFIAKTWRITTPGMFAGSCIGVILLSMALEFMRRAVKEYDSYLIKAHNAGRLAQNGNGISKNGNGTSENGSGISKHENGVIAPAIATGYRPTIIQQIIRAFIHMVQFAVAYFLMLLAMYYNGYIIICIFIGSFIGAFIFQWETIGCSPLSTSATREATVCCG